MLKKIFNNIFNINEIKYGLLLGLMYFIVLYVIGLFDKLQILSIISILLIYVIPIIAVYLSGLWGLITILLSTAFALGFDYYILMWFALILIVPAFIVGYMLKIKKYDYSIGVIISIVAMYGAIINVLTYFYHLEQISLYDTLQDKLQYLLIIINSTETLPKSDAEDLQNLLSVLSIFLPSLITTIMISILYANYKVALFILNKLNYQFSFHKTHNLYPVKYYNALLILLAIITLILHNFLAKYGNLYYIFYNILVILWGTYIYLGWHYAWTYVINTKSFWTTLVFVLLLFLLFLETMLVLSMIGFLVAIGALFYKKI